MSYPGPTPGPPGGGYPGAYPGAPPPAYGVEADQNASAYPAYPGAAPQAVQSPYQAGTPPAANPYQNAGAPGAAANPYQTGAPPAPTPWGDQSSTPSMPDSSDRAGPGSAPTGAPQRFSLSLVAF